jgi:hypothetical protein
MHMEFCAPPCGAMLNAGQPFCLECGAPAEPAGEPRAKDGAAAYDMLSTEDIVKTILLTSALLKFLDSFMAEAGKNAYLAFEKLLASARPHGARAIATASRPAGVAVKDEERHLTLTVDNGIPKDAQRQLFAWNLDHQDLHDGTIAYSHAGKRWEFRGHGTVLYWDSRRAAWRTPPRSGWERLRDALGG